MPCKSAELGLKLNYESAGNGDALGVEFVAFIVSKSMHVKWVNSYMKMALK